jgi:hypothetical protein
MRGIGQQLLQYQGFFFMEDTDILKRRLSCKKQEWKQEKDNK